MLSRGLLDPDFDLMSVEFIVRDPGMRVCDTYRFNADLRVFEVDGSSLYARAAPEHGWTQDDAAPIGERQYDFARRAQP
jgi:hypothetical protein